MTSTTSVRALAVVLVLIVLGSVGGVLAPSGAAGNAERLQYESTVVTYDGQVAVEDFSVRVRGTAVGARELVVVLIDAGGATSATTATTGSDGSFDRNVPLEGAERPLTVGRVEAFVLSPGRDGVFGTGGETPDSARDLITFVQELAAERLTQAQAIQRLERATVDASGSDDLVSRTTFTLARARTEITGLSVAGENVTGVGEVEPGETVLVRGVTNRRPDQNSIDVTLGTGNFSGDVTGTIVDRWGTNGTWTAELEVPEDVELGSYRIQVDDGDSRSTVQVSVVERRQRPTTTTTGTNATTATTATDPTTTSTSETDATTTATTTTATDATTTQERPTTTSTVVTTTGMGETTTTTSTTDAPTPGFGVLVAAAAIVVALVAARVALGGED